MDCVVAGEECGQCGHGSDSHQVLAVFGNPVLGGIICCPEDECMCCSTWGTGGNEITVDTEFLALSIGALRAATDKTDQEIAIMLASIAPGASR